MSRRIAAVTGTRADYGLLRWIMHELRQQGAEIQWIVTGTHLSPRHGFTVAQIEADGWPIAARVELPLESDTPLDVARASASALQGVAEALACLAPDIVLLLGDRYEMLAAAMAASLLRLPIAHVHGGEVTEGAIDEVMRHAITKLSFWHFASTQAYADRIVQMGEAPERVFAVGAPGIDNLARLDLYSRADMEKMLGIALQAPLILCTYHPETLSVKTPQMQTDQLLAALDTFPDATWVITGANADAGGQAINTRLSDWAMRQKRAAFSPSLGSRFYLSFMREADLVLGNSSSALIEAPVLGKAVVNIGDRQAGRLRAENVIDCACEAQAIRLAMAQGMSPEFQQGLKPSELFGTPGGVSAAIAASLLALPLPTSPRKAFHDPTGPRTPGPAYL